MQETVGFNFRDLNTLVIDEADEIINMGYMNTMNSIIEMLPESR
jgi:superfamily II DNA/RNA helicase